MEDFMRQADELIKNHYDYMQFNDELEATTDKEFNNPKTMTRKQYLHTNSDNWRENNEKIKTLIRAGKYFIKVLNNCAFDDNIYIKEINESVEKLNDVLSELEVK